MKKLQKKIHDKLHENELLSWKKNVEKELREEKLEIKGKNKTFRQ